MVQADQASVRQVPPLKVESFRQVLAQLGALIDPAQIDAQQPMGPSAVFTASVTIFLMIYQRLHGQAALQTAVDAFLLQPELFGRPEHSRQETLSANTAAYSRARSRLRAPLLRSLAVTTADLLIQAARDGDDRPVWIFDGTTVSLPHTPDLARAFDPGRNQHGKNHWPIVRMVVAHDLASAAMLLPEWGPVHGPQASDEVGLARGLFPRLPGPALLMADRNFGIFAFFHEATQAGHDVVTRLTAPRFHARVRKAEPVEPGCWTLDWRPSAAERATRPDLPPDAVVRLWLYDVPLPDGTHLFLAATEPRDPQAWAELYRQRWRIENDIRDVKQTLELGRLSVRSEGMWEKELAVGTLTYNLVVQVRRLAAKRANVEPRRISFAGTLSLVRALLESGPHSPEEWEALFERTLRGAAQRKLPNRPGRTSPRTVKRRPGRYPVERRPPDGTDQNKLK